MKAQTKIKMTGLALLATGALAPATAGGATLEVTRTDDPSPDGCQTGDCSLREAVIAANAATGEHKIKVEPGATYTLTIPGDSGANVGDLNVAGTSDLELAGTRKKPVTIDANGATTFDRAFKVDGDLALSDVVITGGIAPLSNDNVARGGGIYVGPVGLALHARLGGHRQQCQPRKPAERSRRRHPQRGHHDSPQHGDQQQHRQRCRVRRRLLYEWRLRVLSDTMLRSNQATFGAGLSGDGGTTFLYNSRIGRNHASANGGALFAINGPEFNLYNVNVDNNSADSSVGGIRARDAIVRLRNVTVTANGAPGISVQDDAGGDAGAIHLANSLIAGNIGGLTPDCRDDTGGRITSSGYNLIGDLGSGGGACSPFAQPGDQFGGAGASVIEARVGIEQPNGGPLLPADEWFWTNAIAANSPALNAGHPDDPATRTPACAAISMPGACRGNSAAAATSAPTSASAAGGVLVNRVGDQVDNTSKRYNLQPTSGDDGFLGLDGKDKLRSGDGNDALCGGEGSDTLKGEAGKDRLDGGPGHDVCIGGPGKDKATGCEVERSIP